MRRKVGKVSVHVSLRCVWPLPMRRWDEKHILNNKRIKPKVALHAKHSMVCNSGFLDRRYFWYLVSRWRWFNSNGIQRLLSLWILIGEQPYNSSLLDAWNEKCVPLAVVYAATQPRGMHRFIKNHNQNRTRAQRFIANSRILRTTAENRRLKLITEEIDLKCTVLRTVPTKTNRIVVHKQRENWHVECDDDRGKIEVGSQSSTIRKK